MKIVYGTVLDNRKQVATLLGGRVAVTATKSQQMQCQHFTDVLAEIGGGGQV